MSREDNHIDEIKKFCLESELELWGIFLYGSFNNGVTIETSDYNYYVIALNNVQHFPEYRISIDKTMSFGTVKVRDVHTFLEHLSKANLICLEVLKTKNAHFFSTRLECLFKDLRKKDAKDFSTSIAFYKAVYGNAKEYFDKFAQSIIINDGSYNVDALYHIVRLFHLIIDQHYIEKNHLKIRKIRTSPPPLNKAREMASDYIQKIEVIADSLQDGGIEKRLFRARTQNAFKKHFIVPSHLSQIKRILTLFRI